MSSEQVRSLLKSKTILTNLELQLICQTLQTPVLVCMRNELNISKFKKNKCFILNMDGDNEGKGTHWVAVYRDGKTVYYMDSYGKQIPEEQFRLLHNNGYDMYQSSKQIQAVTSTCCGWFCALFVIMMHMNPQLKPLARFERFQQQFNGSDQRGNDKRVKTIIANLVA
jgi:hypothetical protein